MGISVSHAASVVETGYISGGRDCPTSPWALDQVPTRRPLALFSAAVSRGRVLAGDVTPDSISGTAPVVDLHAAWADVLLRYADRRFLGRTPAELHKLVAQLTAPLLDVDDTVAPSFRIADRIGEANIAELIARYEAGATMRELASRFGMARTSVANLLRAEGIRLRPQTKPIPLDDAASAYVAGDSLAIIATRYSVSASWLQEQLLAAGVAMRPRRGGRRHTPLGRPSL